MCRDGMNDREAYRRQGERFQEISQHAGDMPVVEATGCPCAWGTIAHQEIDACAVASQGVAVGKLQGSMVCLAGKC